MNILIAVPCFGGQLYANFFTSVLALVDILKEKDIKYDIQIIQNESLITRARNSYVSIFMENHNYTHMLFLDNDLLFDPKTVLNLLQSGKEICGISYPKKNLNWDKIRNYSKMYDNDFFIQVMATDMNYNLKLDDKDRVSVENGFIESNDIPTGMMLIDKRAMTSIIHKNRDNRYRNNVAGYNNKNTFYDLFQTGVVDGIYLSEDYYFCKLARDAGIKLYLFVDATIGHTGKMDYFGNLGMTLRSGDSLNLDSQL
tara:strand:+ start:249 stop:1013 length:765 start_codon:yes stop_codon:yes gene_type:complete